MEKTDYPGIFLRVKAVIIDSLALILLMVAITDIFSRFENVPNYAKIITFIFVFILYEPLMISFLGSTIGHKINHLKVEKLNTHGRLNFGFALVRFIIKATLGWVSFITISSSDHKQAIHDTVVNSVVVYD